MQGVLSRILLMIGQQLIWSLFSMYKWDTVYEH